MAGTGGGCFICPGFFGIYVGCCPDPSGCPGDVVTWFKLPHTQSWELNPDVEDPSEIRTDATNGVRVKACPGVTSYTVDVTSALCTTDYLPCYLFDTRVGCTGELFLDLGVPKLLTAFLTQDSTVVPTGSYTDNGIYVNGFANPLPFGGDNDSSDPVTVDWTFEVSDGPFWGTALCTGGAFPACTGPNPF